MYKLILLSLINTLRRRFVGKDEFYSKNQGLRMISSPYLAEQNGPDDQSKSDETTGSSANNGRPKQPSEDGPPDLDVLWNDFNRRLGSLFGSKPGKDDKPTSGQESASARW